MMSVVVETNQKERYVIAKGAPDVLMNRSSHMMHGGRTATFSKAHRQETEAAIQGLQDKRLEPLRLHIKK